MFGRLLIKLLYAAWKVYVFGIFLVRISPYLSVFSPNVVKYGPEKLQIRTLFTQRISLLWTPFRSSPLEVLLYNFTEITLWHGCSPVNLLHIFRIPFPKNTSGWLLLTFGNHRFLFSFKPVIQKQTNKQTNKQTKWCKIL